MFWSGVGDFVVKKGEMRSSGIVVRGWIDIGIEIICNCSKIEEIGINVWDLVEVWVDGLLCIRSLFLRWLDCLNFFVVVFVW